MSKSYMNALKETFENPEGFTPEKLQALIQETLSYFKEMQAQFTSKDPAVREAATKAALEMKVALEGYMENLCKLTGLDPAQLSSFAEDTSRMTSTEKEAFDDVKKQLHQLRPVAHAHEAFKRRVPKLNLAG